jgi:integrase
MVSKNRKVSLYITSRIGKRWTYRPAPKKNPKNLTDGSSYVLFWYEGFTGKGLPGKRSLNVGNQLDAARIAKTRKEAELRMRIVEGQARPEPEPDTSSNTPTVKDAVDKFLEECQDRCGQDGYGFAKRSLIVYRRSLGYLREFGGGTPLIAMDEQFFKTYRRWLREHRNKFSDRSCHNILLTANTMARANGITAGKKVLAEMWFPPKPCDPYSAEELRMFFEVCTPQEALVYKFFVLSGCGEQEVANTEIRDLDFAKNVLHISPKPERGFRLKSKKGNAALGRKVPLPSAFMRQLQGHCKGKSTHDLVFPNSRGCVEGHFLRKCQRVAKRAGLTGMELHRFRKTFATQMHEGGASVRQVQSWLGHTDLDTTLIYLGVQDSADESRASCINASR